MYKYALILMLLSPIAAFSQYRTSLQRADSLSYQYYINGDWNKLISFAKDSFERNIDSGLLRQRAGYAYYMKGDYLSAKLQYEKAAKFNPTDENTKNYLYYSSLMDGSFDTRFYAGRLSPMTKLQLGIEKTRPVESFDSEINIKTNQTTTRSNQIYTRIGVNTEFNYRLSLYQAIAYYQQTISNSLTVQPEYMALFRYTLSPFLQLKGTYHLLYANVSSVSYPAHLGLLAATGRSGQFTLNANASLMRLTTGVVRQFGAQATMEIPGKTGFYVKSGITQMKESGAGRTIFSEYAGLKLLKNTWIEGNLTLGNLKNYTTYDGLYVYNAVDPSVFRSGATIYWICGKHLSLLGNFTFDQQQLINTSTTDKYYYYQNSYSIGLKWKR